MTAGPTRMRGSARSGDPGTRNPVARAPSARLALAWTRALEQLRPLLRAAVFFSVVQMVGQGLLYLMQVVISRQLTPEAFGLYASGWSWLVQAAAIGAMGLPLLVLRELARRLPVAGEAASCRRMVRIAWLAIEAVTLAVIIVAALALFLTNAAGGGTSAFVALVVLLLGALAYASLLLFEHVGRPLERIGDAFIPRQIGVPLAVLAVVLAVPFEAGGHDTLLAIACVITGALVVAALVQARLLAGRLPPGDPAAPAGLRRAAVVPFSLVAIGSAVMLNSDVIVMSLILPPADIAGYFAAKRTALIVTAALGAISVMFAPRLAALHARGDRAGIESLLNAVAITLTLAAFAAFAAIALGGPTLLSLFGAAYGSAYPLLLVLLAGQCINVATGPCGFILSMTGHERSEARILVASAIAYAVLLLPAIWLYGTTGAAAATTISVVAMNLALWWQGRRMTGYDGSALRFVTSRSPRATHR